MATIYKNPTEAATALTSAFNPNGTQLTAAQLAAINNAASLVPTQPNPQLNTGVINSTNITPTTPITPTQPTYTPPTDTSGLNTATTLGTNEKKASDLIKEVQTLNESAVGKSAYQTEQNTLAGVDTIQQAINDNNTAIRQLQNEANQSKISSEGRQAPMFAIIGEQAQIERQRSFKALGLASISDALSNNLVAAQAKADKAVADKYGAIEAEQKAKLANLELILKDPQTTLEEKNRANAQAILVQAQADKTAQDKANQAAILKTANEAATNAANFTPSTVSGAYYPTLSSALNAIASAKTPEEALSIQAATGLITKTESWSEPYLMGGDYVQRNNKTGEIRTAVNVASGATTNAKDQANDVASAIIDFQQQIQNKGWAGANPDAYNYYRTELANLYGASAVLALDKAMSDAGITVDYVNK